MITAAKNLGIITTDIYFGVTWKSSDKKIATVSKKGVVKIKKKRAKLK